MISKIDNNLKNNTSAEFDEVVKVCKDIFLNKMKDYGASWRVLRPRSITDQIFIKAQRIRSIEDKGVKMINEEIDGEFMGILNYCVIALIQLEENFGNDVLTEQAAEMLYDQKIARAKDLMTAKNHDYGEAWRDMRISSFTDLILMKIMRVKQIEDNEGRTIISEGITSHFFDMINYAIFALIKLQEQDAHTSID